MARLLIFALVFMALLAAVSLAKGLEITQIDARVDYDESYVYRLEQQEQQTRLNYAAVPVANNSKINVEVLPGSNITFGIRAENTFQGTDDPTIRNVEVTTTIEGIEGGEDLEEKSLDFDLEPGNDYRADIKLNIPVDFESGAHNVKIQVEGEGRNGTSYRTELRLKLDIKRQGHDIRITKVSLDPTIVDCNRKIKLTAEIMNAGSNAENEIALELKSASLGVNSYDKDIFLDASNEADDQTRIHTKTLSIEAPSFFKSGTYQILVNLYWRNFILFDRKTADLIVRDCSPGAVKANAGEGLVTPIQPQEENKKLSAENLITSTIESSGLNSPLLASVLLGAFVIIILAVLVAFGYLRKSRVQ